MRILWAGPALRELEEALDYIARDDPGASDRLGHKLHAAVGRLARFPDLGRMVPEVEDPTLREIVEPCSGSCTNGTRRSSESWPFFAPSGIPTSVRFRAAEAKQD